MSSFMISSELDQKDVFIKKIIPDEMAPFRIFSEYFTFSECEDTSNLVKQAYIQYISSYPNVINTLSLTLCIVIQQTYWDAVSRGKLFRRVLWASSN